MGEGAKGLEVKAGGANTSPRGSIKRTCRAAETHHWYFSHVHGMDIGMCRFPELGGVPCLPLLYICASALVPQGKDSLPPSASILS